MLLTLTTTAEPAGDLGFLVHKHPDRTQSFPTSAGVAHVVWPEVSDSRATVALLLEVDPVGLVRGRKPEQGGLAQYVNDRPYAASSMLSSALGKVFRTAMSGRCEARPELAGSAIPLEVHVPAVPSRGGADLVRALFGPLGWDVSATPLPLDETVPAWGDSRYVDLRLTGTLRLADALSQLYVLLPVLDDSKHYWVSVDEVDKLLRAGAGWLTDHPERDLITRRFLTHRPSLVQSATERLAELDGRELPAAPDEPEEKPAKPLAVLRKIAVLAALEQEGARSVVDLGCGEGALLKDLAREPRMTRITAVDVSHRALEIAVRRAKLDKLSDTQRARVTLLQSSLTYRDDRIAGHDAVVLMEVVEHVDVPRLPALERSVFQHAAPATVVVTTPNVEHNVLYPFLPVGQLRHPDHRFEWTRAEFAEWCAHVCSDHGYTVRFVAVGEDDPVVGAPTQMAVFRRAA